MGTVIGGVHCGVVSVAIAGHEENARSEEQAFQWIVHGNIFGHVIF